MEHITLNEKEIELLYEHAIAVWESNDIKEMALYGYALATAMDAVFRIKKITDEECTDKICVGGF